jgi:acetyltransferase-like isoleucine patch superfamily enzyme
MNPRELIKRLIFLASATAMSPFYGLYRLNALFLDKETAFQGLSQLVSLMPGRLGTLLRKGFYALSLERCSPDCAISFGTIVSTPDCEIGRHVYIGAYCVISDSVIGDDCLIGSHVHIISGKHAHGFDASDTPMRLQKSSRRAIHIGRNSWIGNGAIVMADVGNGCVVGAGSVVTKKVGDDSVVAGNPARFIRQREDTPR